MFLKSYQVHQEQRYRNTPFIGSQIEALPLTVSMGAELPRGLFEKGWSSLVR